MTVVEIPPGSGNRYKYVYEDGKTVYKGPVGDSPQLTEEEFLEMMKADTIRDKIIGELKKVREDDVAGVIREEFKDWKNYGDVNPQEHGGIFIKLSGPNSIEVVTTTNGEDAGFTEDDQYVQVVDLYADEITKALNNPEEDVGGFVDVIGGWENSVKPLEGSIIYLITGWTQYHGADDTETHYNIKTDDDYDKMLRQHGIEDIWKR